MPTIGEEADDYNQGQIDAGNVLGVHLTPLVTSYQQRRKLPLTGRLAPAVRVSLAMDVPRPLAAEIVARETITPGGWAPWDGPLERQPRNRAEIYKTFGNPGTGRADRRWKRANIVRAVIPGLPRALWVHKLIEPYVREACRRSFITCPEWKPERAACFVFRHQHHNPARPLSNHAFAIAVDFDPKKNSVKKFPRAQAPDAWTDPWKRLWPDGLPEGVVRAFQSCGFAWGADWDEDGQSSDHRYIDPMHFEFVARDGRARSV
jgi:hypothetical protein